MRRWRRPWLSTPRLGEWKWNAPKDADVSTRSVKLAQLVRYDNRPVGHYLTSNRRSLKYQEGTVPDQAS